MEIVIQYRQQNLCGADTELHKWVKYSPYLNSRLNITWECLTCFARSPIIYLWWNWCRFFRNI